MGNDFAFLAGYQPEKVADDFAPFKGNYTCVVNSAKIEDYDGEKEEFKGHKFFRYELEVASEQPNAGRRLWKSVDLQDDKDDEKGKSKLKKLADTFFTLGLDITKDEDREQFAEMSLNVECWIWKKSKEEEIQLHKIKRLAQGSAVRAASSVPF